MPQIGEQEWVERIFLPARDLGGRVWVVGVDGGQDLIDPLLLNRRVGKFCQRAGDPEPLRGVSFSGARGVEDEAEPPQGILEFLVLIQALRDHYGRVIE